MEIRNFMKEDLKAVVDLIDRGKPYVVPYNLYVYWMLQNYYGTTCKVLEFEDRIIGYISAMPSVDENTLFIWQVCVDIDYRGKGLGTLLLTSIRDEASRLGYDNLQFSISDTNLASQTLFKGFAENNKMNIFEKSRVEFEHLTEIIFQINI